MSYKIISVTQENNNNITTKTEFTLSNGSVKIVSQTHFQPHSKESVITGIENQEVVEERNITLPSIVANVKAELDSMIGEQMD